MSTNQTLSTTMLGALELVNPVTITSTSGVLTLTAVSNSFIADGAEAITSIVGNSDVTQGIYIITWNTARTLTYNSSTLLLIGQANRTSAIGDIGIYQIVGDVATELFYSPVSGKVASAAAADTATTSQTCTGNAATATKLATARAISLTGDVTGSGTFDGSADLSIAATGIEAAKLTTARTITLTGAITGSGTFDGSEDLSITTTTSLSSLPTGAIIHYAGSSAPSGYLLCDGSAVSRTTYAALYNVIGTTYGTGDGSTTFNLPSIKDKFVLGLGSTYSTLAATGGETTHTLTVSEMPAHDHQVMEYAGPSGVSGATQYSAHINSNTNGASSNETAYTGGSGAHNNMPPYIVLNYCIKY